MTEFRSVSLSGVINDVMNVMDLHTAEAGVELYHDARGWDGEDVTVYTCGGRR